MKSRFDKNALKLVRASFKELITLAASDGEAKDLPSQIRLFKLGANETTKGIFYLADWCIDACLYAQTERGVDYPINKNHSFAEAYGWFGCVRGEAGGLYAGPPPSKPEQAGIWWLDTPAVEEVRKGQWRYTSAEFWLMPEYITDDEGYYVDCRYWIVEIVGLALTNYPATYGAEPLLASDIQKNAPYFAQLSARSPLEFQMTEVEKKAAAELAAKNQPAPPSVTAPTATPEQLQALWVLACELTKKEAPAEVLGALRAHAYSHEQLAVVSKELITLKSQNTDKEEATKQSNEQSQKQERLSKAAAAVDKAIQEFKLAPASRETTLHLAGEDGAKVDELLAFLSTLHPIIGPASVKALASNVNATTPTTPKAPVILSAIQKEVAKKMGLTDEQYAEAMREGVN